MGEVLRERAKERGVVRICVPDMYSIWPRVKFSCSPLHSRALMPNREVKKERGRKLDGWVVG